ncbi:MAG: dihydroneopterin aldolase [Steroidobacteraceae bacterium]|jgi:dihydroneopterin aldolase
MTIKPDTVFLRGLEVECIIGFIDWERRIKQKVLIDLELPIDCARAAASDDVADTLDYMSVTSRVREFVGESQFMLVETMAHRLALLLLEEFDIEWIRLSINKPGAVRGSRDVGVSIERRRNALTS